MRKYTSSDIMGNIIIAAVLVLFVCGLVVKVQKVVAEQKCVEGGYTTTKHIGFNTWCSKVVNGSTVTIKVR